MDWIPVVFIAFKVLVFGAGMFFAIKWHYDQGQKKDMPTVLRTGALVATVFVLSALALVFLTFTFARWMGMDLRMP